MMMNVLFFTFIEKYVVAMRCYGYCSLVRVAELPTGEKQNSKTWPTISDQIQPVRSRGRKISILAPWLLDYSHRVVMEESTFKKKLKKKKNSDLLFRFFNQS